MLAEYFLFLATTYHFWVQIMILILVGQLPTHRVEFGLGEVWEGKGVCHCRVFYKIT